MLNPWLSLTFKTMKLGFDAQNVIALRMMRFAAGGPSGQNEARRMVTEKIAAGVQAQLAAVSGIITGPKGHSCRREYPSSLAEKGSREQTPIVSQMIRLMGRLGQLI